MESQSSCLICTKADSSDFKSFSALSISFPPIFAWIPFAPKWVKLRLRRCKIFAQLFLAPARNFGCLVRRKEFSGVLFYFVGQNFSAYMIVSSTPEFRHFCPPKFCMIYSSKISKISNLWKFQHPRVSISTATWNVGIQQVLSPWRDRVSHDATQRSSSSLECTPQDPRRGTNNDPSCTNHVAPKVCGEVLDTSSAVSFLST